MKIFFTSALLLLTILSFSQKNTKSIYSENSGIKVVYMDSLNKIDNNYRVFNSKNKSSKIFINGVFIENVSLNTINPEKIEQVNIEKIVEDNEAIVSNLLVTMKPDYTPNFITVKKLINKYLKIDNDPIVFQINNYIVNKDYKKYKVDENYILKIELRKIKTSKNSTINLIKIITKTEKNIEEANKIMIR